MINPAIFEFLKALREHNSRKYFATIRPLYDDIWDGLHHFVQIVAQRLEQYDPAMKEVVAKQCLYRIYRDARRLRDGDFLYKYNFGALISPEGKRTTKSYPYIHIEPSGSFFAGGIYRPTPHELFHLRQFMAKHGDEYYSIVSKPAFKKRFGEVSGQILKKLPQWRDVDTAYPELVKRKQWLIYAPYQDHEVLSTTFIDQIEKDYCLARSFFDFLNRGMVSNERRV